MKTLSLKLDENIFEETEEMIKLKGIARNRYINEALDFYNQLMKRKALAADFSKASKMVKKSSMQINQEFDNLIDEGSI